MSGIISNLPITDEKVWGAESERDDEKGEERGGHREFHTTFELL